MDDLLADPTKLAAVAGVAVLALSFLFTVVLAKPKTPFLVENKRKVVNVPLIEREMLSRDTVRLRFGLPTVDTVLGLPVGACLKFFCPNVTGSTAGLWNGRPDAEKDEAEVERKYTPTSSDRQKGSFDLVVKVYNAGQPSQFPDGGKMSQFMGRLKVGDHVQMSGPWGTIEYTAPGTFVQMKRELRKTHVAMMAGGSGITPMLQVLTAVFENPGDATQCSLIYANKSEEDILVRDMLEALALKYPTRFHLHYTLDSPPAAGSWGGSVGFITEQMIQDHLPAPGPGTVVLMCGPPPMVQYACKANLEKLGYDKKDMLAF